MGGAAEILLAAGTVYQSQEQKSSAKDGPQLPVPAPDALNQGSVPRIPTIAYGHHCKLNGSGYPNDLRSEDIPFRAKMMTVCDIYDALTDWDPPYTRALPAERALDIQGLEVKGWR